MAKINTLSLTEFIATTLDTAILGEDGGDTGYVTARTLGESVVIYVTYPDHTRHFTLDVRRVA